jgi:hypothetical protein
LRLTRYDFISSSIVGCTRSYGYSMTTVHDLRVPSSSFVIGTGALSIRGTVGCTVNGTTISTQGISFSASDSNGNYL